MPDLDRRSTWRSIDFLYLAFILLIAGALRLLNLDYAEFKGDEADNLLAALPIITRGRLPLAGIESSIGTFNPPLFSYLLAIPLFFSRDPVVATAFVARSIVCRWPGFTRFAGASSMRGPRASPPCSSPSTLGLYSTAGKSGSRICCLCSSSDSFSAC